MGTGGSKNKIENNIKSIKQDQALNSKQNKINLKQAQALNSKQNKIIIKQAQALTRKQNKIIIKQQLKSLCQINTKEGKGAGFLCSIPNPVLITSSDVLNGTQIETGEEISIYFTGEDENKYPKIIKIDDTRTTYSIEKLNDEEIYTTIIELKPDIDDLNEQEFIEMDKDLMNENLDLYKTESIYLIYYEEGDEDAMSVGIVYKILKKDETYTLFHTCNTDHDSTGCPIMLYNHKVIGLNRGHLSKEKFNTATILQYPIKEYLKKFGQEKLILEKKRIDENNKITMRYRINKDKENIKILGSIFVANNKANFRLLINENIYNLCEYIEYEKYGINKNDDSLTIFLAEIKTQNIDNMTDMFGGCESLISIDFGTYNTEKITNMCCMFYKCKSLISISSFNTQNVTNMDYMFYECSSLSTLDLSFFDTLSVTDMKYMFYCCSSLTTLNLSSFNTQNVTNMCSMFGKCKSLKLLDLTSFDTQNVTNMSYMFGENNEGCSSLTTIDLSSFNTEKVTNMNSMFAYCSGLTSLELKPIKTQNVINMKNMFAGCSSLTTLNLLSFKTQNVVNMRQMFLNCSSLSTLILESFELRKGVDTRCMFDGCEKLSQEKIDKFNNKTNKEIKNQKNWQE